MLVHIANAKTLKTLCGKTVDRRYWVSITQQRRQYGVHGTMFCGGCNCKCCLNNFKRKAK